MVAIEEALRSLRLGVLASGGGTNLQAIIDACAAGVIPAAVVVVISNNSNAGALARARAHGIPAYHLSNRACADERDLDAAIVQVLRRHRVELVLFAGYMKRRGKYFLDVFRNRVLNIHPALLPGRHGGAGKYGRYVHESVLAAGDVVTGVTIHLVDEEYDHGVVVARRKVPVLPGDTVDTLQQRVIAAEHELYPAVIGAVARGEIDLDAIAAGAAPARYEE